ncbi:MAG: hypothetical protein AB7U66_13640 [Hyphomicrobiaceae bacterium]
MTVKPPQRAIQWGRVGDYLFGRNAMIGIASLMLLVISGYATWSGMADFIIGVSTSSVGQGRELPGGLSVSNEILVIAIVTALTFLMWLVLRETFGPGRKKRERVVTFALYFFLALWSIGFGYGFWWSLIAGEEATRTSLSGLQEDARDASTVIAARLDAVKVQLDSVVSWSESRMALEETSGGSCGVPSGSGRGPLYNARRSVRDSIATLREGIMKSWIAPVQTDLDVLRQTAAGLEGGTVIERQRQFEARAAQIRGRARNIAARSNALGNSTATEMRALAAAVGIEPGKPGFSCYDPTLAQRLRQAADQAGQPALLRLRAAAFNEGPAGVANAIKNLWENVGTYSASLVRYVVSGGKAGGDKTAGGQAITGRDLIALLATLGIDLGLFVLTVLNPPTQGVVRRDALREALPELHLPTSEVVHHLSSAFQTAIDRAPGGDLEWVRKHFLHHNGSSYFVIPNLYAAAVDDDEQLRALAMNQLAGVLDDLKLVKALTPDELKKFGEEEKRDSFSDLTPYMGGRADEMTKPGAQPVRNHGLLSKAARVLHIAGWSKSAYRDVEIFRLVDAEGLTPLLIVLNQGKMPTEDAEPVAAKPAGEPKGGDTPTPLKTEPPRQLTHDT